MPAASLKRSHPSSPDLELQPLSTRALPEAVWEDHLLMTMMCKDVARLGCTCQALRAVVREHSKDLGTVQLKTLRGALTTFPRARKVMLEDKLELGPCGEEEKDAMFQWLCEGDRGRYLDSITVEDLFSDSAKDFVHKALQAGALPSLKSVDVSLDDEDHELP
jgi:hypothetical protein